MNGSDAAARRARLGRLGEAAAAAELERRGYRVVARNYRVRGGEADLVALHGGELVFVEVKARSGFRYGRPAEAVDARKRRRLVIAAESFLQARADDEGLIARPARFDVVEVVVLQGEIVQVEVLPHAFHPEE